MQVVYDTLRELKVEDKKIVTLLNKQDKLLAPMVVKDFRADASLAVSAKTGQGLEDLKNLLSSWMMEGKIYIERLYPYDKAGTISLIRGKSLCTEGYLSEGIEVWQAGLKTAVHPFKRRTAPKNGRDRTQVKVPYLVMLENFTLDMVLFTIDGRNMLCYHMVQTLQRVEP